MDHYQIEKSILLLTEEIIKELQMHLKSNPEMLINVMQHIRTIITEPNTTSGSILRDIEREWPELEDLRQELKMIRNLALIISSNYVYLDFETGKAIRINQIKGLYLKVEDLFLEKCNILNIPSTVLKPKVHWGEENEADWEGDESEESEEEEDEEEEEGLKMEIINEAEESTEESVEKRINRLSLNEITQA